MINQKNGIATRTDGIGRLGRSATGSFVGWLLLAAAVAGVPGCEQPKQSKVDEAVEEIEDEAKDAKDEIKDEIDDHT